MDKEAIYNQILVLRCQQGQQDAWEELVRRWQDPLLYYIRRMVADEQQAWQILQEVWLEVLRGIYRLECPDCLPKWLYSISRNTILSWYRKHYKDAELLETIANGAPDACSDETNTLDNAEQVHWGLNRLKPLYREALTLFFLQDLSVEEMAEILNIPEGTVKSRLFYARKELRRLLEAQNNE